MTEAFYKLIEQELDKIHFFTKYPKAISSYNQDRITVGIVSPYRHSVRTTHIALIIDGDRIYAQDTTHNYTHSDYPVTQDIATINHRLNDPNTSPQKIIAAYIEYILKAFPKG
jgi:hypothetical protein